MLILKILTLLIPSAIWVWWIVTTFKTIIEDDINQIFKKR
jgi:hypothetical protein